MAITPELVAGHNLSAEEYGRILEILGRQPNYVELGIFSAMWSEHCSYKSSRLHLRKFPTTGSRVIQGPGENAGVVDIGDGLAVAFKMESHNHPSFIEPYQGAATGVGGILRDIFTMGARPIASLNSLRFGSLDAPRMKHIVDGVVRGIAGYGNCMGIPTVGGETTFHSAYNGNILVNVFNAGIVRADRIFLGRAEGAGNPVVYVGSKTGRDGIHGATMASEEFAGNQTSQKRPNVQVGDPFTEKLLLEACLELFATDAVVGIQDMGAAGLTSSTFEMAGRAGSGVEIDLSKVPARETGMTPYEIMLSESQERMLLVCRSDRLPEVLAIFRKWELDAVEIGKVTDTGRVVLFFGGEKVADLPAAPLADEAPVYDRPRRPAAAPPPPRWPEEPEPSDYGACLRRILASPNVSEKSWIWTQYDHMVGTNTVERPGGDAAIVRVKGTARALALKSDVNPFFCALDPYRGAAIAVAEAARSISCTGGRPLAITDCLNFGNPEKPDVMAQFEAAVRGISDACRAFEIPVVSGNVSFYNETDGRAIPPTPTVGMVGLLEDVDLRVAMAFRRDGDRVALLGQTRDELGGSEFLRTVRGRDEGPCPEVDLAAERRLCELLLDLAASRSLSSAHDVADGGLAVALAESAMAGALGADIEVPGFVRHSALLFGESTGRAVVSFASGEERNIAERAAAAGVPLVMLGRIGGPRLRIARGDAPPIDEDLRDLTALWRSAFRRSIESAELL
ncbi:MAG: phosphoribosylformylglycinamidine synthase subunit PurL [Acidobacteria bacterium]|nr:phosphoribosylformylglycinamidine synthase subunit PurL [Acidobacteriota bacterium]